MSFAQHSLARLQFVVCASLLSMSALAGCGRKDEPSPAGAVTPAATPTAPDAAPADAQRKAGAVPPASTASNPQAKVLWTVPKDWKEMPARPMRKATYQAEGKSGQVEIAVFYFGPGDGGGVDANIERWIGQFQALPEGAAKRSQNKVGELIVHDVRVDKGTFASGMPGGPAKSEEGWGMHAAVAETPAGNYFFKMLGPAEAVTEQESNFTSLLQSLHVE